MKIGFLLGVALLLGYSAATADKVAPLLDHLGSDDFLTRQQAAEAVAQLGLESFDDVQKHAAKHKDPEVRKALENAAKLIAAKAITRVKAFAHPNDVGPKGWVNRTVFTPDGKHLITGGGNNIRVWEMATGNLVRTFNQGNRAWAVSLSPDQNRLAAAGARMLRIFDWKSGKLEGELAVHKKDSWGAAYSVDGEHVYSCAADGSLGVSNTVKLAHEKSIPLKLPQGRGVIATPDGVLVCQKAVDNRAPGVVTLIDPDTGKVERTFDGHDGGIPAMALSRDRKRLLTGSFDQSAILWDYSTGKKIHRFKAHRDVIEGVAFAPDGKMLTVCSSGFICLWTQDSDKLLWRLPKRIGALLSINFTPDGKHFVTTGKDGAILIWRYGFVK